MMSNACYCFSPQIKGVSFLRRFVIRPIISEYPSIRFQKKLTMPLKVLIPVWLVGDGYSTIALILSESAATPSWPILKPRYFNFFCAKAHFSILIFNPTSHKA